MNMFEWELTLKFIDGTQEITKFEPLIWYEGPKMFVDIEGKLLLVWYEDKEDEELWFLIKNPLNIRKYIANQKTLKELVLEGPVFLVKYDFENDIYFVEDQLSENDLKKNFTLPADDSFLGNLYTEADRLLELLDASFIYHEEVPPESLKHKTQEDKKSSKPFNFFTQSSCFLSYSLQRLERKEETKSDKNMIKNIEYSYGLAA